MKRSAVEFLKSILSNVIASCIVPFFGFVSAIVLAIVKPIMLPYIITAILLIIVIVVLLSVYTFGVTKFKWYHYQTTEKHTMTLNKDNTGVDEQTFVTQPKKNFKGIVEGFFDWQDVSVTKVKFNAIDTRINFESIGADKKSKKTSGKDTITVDGDPVSANYQVKFLDNEPRDVQVITEFTYDIEIMKPEFYYEASRPVKKLIMELKVEEGVQLHNVGKSVMAHYGDKRDFPTIKIYGKKSDENPSLTVYRFVIKKPKILYNYRIVWEWTNID